jgi:hypothetical protein
MPRLVTYRQLEEEPEHPKQETRGRRACHDRRMPTTSSDVRLPDPWKLVDPLGEALGFLRMSGVFY